MAISSESTLRRTGKPVAAGIINIIVGSCCLLAVVGMGIAAAVASPFLGDFPFRFPLLVGFLALIPAALGVVSVVGGVFALQRKMWGWALAGSITTLVLSHVLGIVSLILNILAKDEFSR